MFDTSVVEELEAAAAALAELPVALATGAEQLDLVARLHAVQTSLDAVKADALAHADDSLAYAEAGAASLAGWARHHLHLAPRQARTLAASAATLGRFPGAREAMHDGQITLDHVAQLTYARRHLPARTVDETAEFLVEKATELDPADLHRVIGRLQEVKHPEELEGAWARGQDKTHLTLSPLPDGWFVRGFLDILTGARLKGALTAFGRPTDPDDTRTVSQRQVDGLSHLLAACPHTGVAATEAAEAAGKPAPVTPPLAPPVLPGVDLTVVVDHDTLTATLGSDDQPSHARRAAVAGHRPAHLVGFGPVGPDLLSRLHCGARRTGILTTTSPAGTGTHHDLDRLTDVPGHRSAVLDVGRTHRLATPRQRAAVTLRQGQRCAAPGCHHAIADVHHVTWWSHDGRTDLDNLIGLCHRCHTLVHQRRLAVSVHLPPPRPLAGTSARRVPTGAPSP